MPRVLLQALVQAAYPTTSMTPPLAHVQLALLEHIQQAAQRLHAKVPAILLFLSF